MSRTERLFRFFHNRPLASLAAIVLIVVVSIGLAKLALSKGSQAGVTDFATFAVKRGPLRISVTESGTIKAREQVILKSGVEGRTSILTLVAEGTRVKKGDLLVELDASRLLDSKVDQEIRVQNVEAAFISAEENLAVVENQAQSDIDKAELAVDFAKLDMKKYLDPNNGEYRNELDAVRARIKLFQEELTRANDRLDWSRRLYEEKYISQMELKADELAASRRKTDVELERNSLSFLETFTYERRVKQLKSDVKQADMALERTRRKAKADVKQAEANFKAKESEDNRQKDKLKKIDEQIVKTKIYAPAGGLVIYATSAARGHWRSSTEPLAEGQEVRERQELIYLPIGASVKAEVDIHESSLKKVRKGLPAIISVDALPGKSFLGSVAHIAPLPDATSMWMNPDLKVYNTEIYLDDNDDTLRTGMSCKAEIIVEQYKDAIYVPVQAVLRVGGETTVFVVNGKDYEPRKVEIGLDNNRMVRIMNGLGEGEIVLLAPPLKAAGVEALSAVAAAGTTADDENADAIESKLSERLQEVDEPERGQRQRGRRSENISAEQREKMRERFRNMSEEEREKLRQQRTGDR